MVHMNIDVGMYGWFGPPFLYTKSTNSSQCLIFGNDAWSSVDATTISVRFDVSPANNNHENHIWQPSEVTCCLCAHAPSHIPRWWLVPSTSLILRLSNCNWTFRSHHLNVLPATPFRFMEIKQWQGVLECLQLYATALCLCCGLSQSSFHWSSHWIMNRFFFSRILATHIFFHLLDALKLGCCILLAACFKENSICFRLIGGMPAAPSKSDKSCLASAASHSSYNMSCNGGHSVIPALSGSHWITGCGIIFVWRLMRCLPVAPEAGWGGGVEQEDVCWLTGWLPGGSEITLGARSDNGPCPGQCRGGNISDPL